MNTSDHRRPYRSKRLRMCIHPTFDTNPGTNSGDRRCSNTFFGCIISDVSLGSSLVRHARSPLLHCKYVIMECATHGNLLQHYHAYNGQYYYNTTAESFVHIMWCCFGEMIGVYSCFYIFNGFFYISQMSFIQIISCDLFMITSSSATEFSC